MDIYASHQEALVAGALLSGAPNCSGIEFGMGDYSTPLLHHLCGKSLLSIESDASWLNKFKSYESNRHKIQHIPENVWYDTLRNMNLRCDFAFVDSITGKSRVEVLPLLMDKAKIVCVHDQENVFNNPKACYAGQIETIRAYKHCKIFNSVSCSIITVLLSNFVSFDG